MMRNISYLKQSANDFLSLGGLSRTPVPTTMNKFVGGESLSAVLKGMSPEGIAKVKSAVANIQKEAESGAFDGLSEAEFEADSDVQVIRDAVKFSVETLSKGRKYVQAEEQVIKSTNPEDWEGEIIDYVNKTVRNGNDITIHTADGEDITITGRTAWKLGDKGTYDDKLYFVKGNASGVIDEIISVSKGKDYKPPKKVHNNGFAEKGFRYKTAFFRDLDGGYYKLNLSVGINADGKEMYNIGKIEKVPFPVSGSKATTGTAPSMNSIYRNGEIVNKNFEESLSDNINGVNRVLGETQRKFFEAFGLQVEMDERLDANAKILLDEGKVIVSPYAVINDWEIVRHEFTHQLKILVPEAYELYTRLARQEIGGKWDEYYKEAENDYTGYYARRGKNAEVTPELIEEEVYARYAEGLDNNAFIEKVANENATLGAKIRNLLKNIIERIKGMFSRGELKGNTDSIKKIISAKDAWENAVIEAAKKKGKGNGKRYSIYKVDGKIRVVVDRDITRGETNIDTRQKVRDYIKDNYDKIAVGEKGTVYVTERGAKEFAFSEYSKDMEGKEKYDKFRMADNIDELITSMFGDKYETPKHIRNDDIIGFYRAPVEVQVGNRVYNVSVLTAITKDYKEEFYDVVDFDLIKKDEPHPNLISTAEFISRSRRLGGDSSKNSIPQERQSVNKEFVESSEDRVRQLESENEKLKEANDFLKEFFVQTGQVHIDALHISDIAEDIKKRYESHMPVRDIGAKLQAIYTKMSEDGARSESDAEKAEIANTAANELFALAQDILEQSDAIDRTMYDRYAELRHDLRTVGLSISSQDARDIPDFNDFRKRNMGRVKITSKGISVDSYYEELIALYPEFFASEEISAPSDRLLRIVEVRDMLDPKYRDVAYSDEEASALAVELYTEYFSDKNAAFEQQSLAKMIKDTYAKSLREQYNDKLKKAVDFYREQMEFYRNLNQNVEDRITAVPMGEENVKGYTDTDYTGEFEWYKSKLKDTGVKFIRRKSPGGKKNTLLMTFERPTREALRENSDYREVIDRVKSRINGNWESGKSAKTQFEYSRSNIWRSFRRFFGDRDYRKMKELILDPLEDSKKQFMHMQEFYSELIYNKVEKELGIKKGSKMSALVQKYGEKVLTEEELDNISEKDMEKIKLADRIFRMCYDGLIDTINDTRRAIYPDADTKAKDLEDEIIRIEKEIGLIELGFMTGDFADVKGFDNYALERIAIRQESAKELAYRIKLNAEHRAASLDAKIEKIEADMASTKNKTTKRYQDMADRLARYEAEKAKWKALAETKQAELAEKINELNSEFKSNTEYFKQKLDKRLKTLNERLGEKQAMLQADEITYGKTIEKRKDYYRHFADLASEVPVFFGYIQQMTQDNGKTVIEAAKEYFDRRSQKSNIDNRLAGKSTDTKPRAKWQSFAQHRADDSTAVKYDAVGGFLEYLPAAAYSAAIDPQISIFRTIAEDLAAKVDGKENNTNLGSFIGYLTEYANDLAGKTHAIDRVIVDSLMSRDAWKKLNWVSGRIKGNMISFNVSSMFAQILNMPNAIATIKNPTCFIGAMGDVVAGIKDGTEVSERYKESQFLNERYTNYYSKFEHGVSATARKVSEWMLQALDEVNGRVIWNAAYRKAVKLGEKSPVRYADDVTRRLIAGRQIGEMQLYQKSRIMGMLMPFSVEVANNWDVIEDIARDSAESGRKHSGVMKAAVVGGQALWSVLLLLASNWLFDELLERLRGSDGGLLNPIKVIEEGIKNGESVEEILGGIAGDAISATPIGSAVASLYPEQGMQFGDKTTPTRAELFGSNDPTRFGTGNMFSSALKKPFNYLVMPGGGSQLDKTMTGYKALKEGAITNKKGEVQYEVDNTNRVNAAKGLLFGKSGFKETSDYYDAKDSKGIYEKYLSRKAGMRKTMQQTELERLIGIDESIKPSKPGMSFEFNDVEYKPGRHYDTYEKMYGRRASQYYNKVMLTDEYKAANDELKIVMVKDAFKNALKDAKAAYVLWAKSGFPKDGGSFEQSFESEFVGKKIVGNSDAAESYTAEGFPKGKGYVEVESGGQVYILQGDAYNAYEKARYDEFAHKSELMNKSGTMTVRNETGAESKNTKMKAILNQLVNDGILAVDVAQDMLDKYRDGAEVEVPIGVEFIAGRQEEYQVGYAELTEKDKKNINKSLKAKVKNNEMTEAEADKYAEDLMSGKITYTKKRYITGDFNSLTSEQQEKVLDSINKAAKEKAFDAVEDRLN
ncbi:MAG: hypothetical protein UIM24_05520 [Clostridia bacterium]|nr:hypothetical protein [Clostridia bacterium]